MKYGLGVGKSGGGGGGGGGGTVESVVAGTGIGVDNTDPSNPVVSSTITQYTDELAQDAVGNILTDTDTINFTYNDGTPTIVADARVQMSITSDSSGLKLSGDSSTPGNNKVYGTDGSGVKGWKADPSGGGGDILILTPSFGSNNQSFYPTEINANRPGGPAVLQNFVIGIIYSGSNQLEAKRDTVSDITGLSPNFFDITNTSISEGTYGNISNSSIICTGTLGSQIFGNKTITITIRDKINTSLSKTINVIFFADL